MRQTQLTFDRGGHVLTHTGVWSADGAWVYYDVRSHDSIFDGPRIERVNAQTGEIQRVYESINAACCGIVTASPVDEKIVLVEGPQNPAPGWEYAADNRRGIIVDLATGRAAGLDARDLVPPFTGGALRGGTHVHVFSPDGQWISFTYNDRVLAALDPSIEPGDTDQRNVGVSVPIRPVSVTANHPRNHAGSHFSVLVTRTTANPAPGSDEIKKACEDAWIGANGYVKPDGSRQRRALAFQGDTVAEDGRTVTEVFVVDIPDDVTIPGDGPLEGTPNRRPLPPRGTIQRRLTFSSRRAHGGIAGPRHWLRSSPDGSRIAFIMKDTRGIAQLWTLSPTGGTPAQITDNPSPIASAFTWSPDGKSIACIIDGSVFIADTTTGRSERVTPRCGETQRLRPEACVFSPDGKKIAFMKTVGDGPGAHNRIFALTLA